MSEITQEQKDAIAKAWRPLYQELISLEEASVPIEPKPLTRAEFIRIWAKIDADYEAMIKNTRIVHD